MANQSFRGIKEGLKGSGRRHRWEDRIFQIGIEFEFHKGLSLFIVAHLVIIVIVQIGDG